MFNRNDVFAFYFINSNEAKFEWEKKKKGIPCQFEGLLNLEVGYWMSVLCVSVIEFFEGLPCYEVRIASLEMI